jgi:hypothetical protein
MKPRNRFQENDSASPLSLAGRYDSYLVPFLAPIDWFKIPAQITCYSANSLAGTLRWTLYSNFILRKAVWLVHCSKLQFKQLGWYFCKGNVHNITVIL